MDGEPEQEATLFPATVGEKLRAAREAQGLELSDIAARTRIPQRHLEAIERSQYGQLPSITYALGFAKSYARAIGADEVTLGRELRAELGNGYERPAPHTPYEMTDPTRTPSRGVAWIGLAVAVLVLLGVGIWYGTGLFRGSAPAPESLITEEQNDSAANAAAAQAVAAPQTGGQVTLVARDTVWMSVADATGKKLFEKEMIPGERYDVPADADHPRVKTGRADMIQVLLNGSEVAPLGPAERTVETEVSADALRTRGQPGATPSPAAAAPVTPPQTRRERRSSAPARRSAPAAATPDTAPPAAAAPAGNSATP